MVNFKKNIFFSLLILSIFTIYGCDQIDLDKLSDDDIKRISENAVICNEPYIRVGIECCLDENNDKICDNEERRPSDEKVSDRNKIIGEEEQNNDKRDQDYEQENDDTEKNNGEDKQELVRTQPNLNRGDTIGITNPNSILSQNSITLQPRGVRFQDPTFGTTLIRVGEVDREVDDIGVIHWERHIYSQLQPFNNDNSLIMVNRNNGLAFRNTRDMSLVYEFPELVWAPKWNPLNKDEIYHYDLSDNRVKLVKTNVRTRVTQDVILFPAKYTSLGIGQSSEEVSLNGKWLGAYVYDANNEGYFVTVNLVEKRIGIQLKERGDLFSKECGRFSDNPDANGGFDAGPNWIGVSPSGVYAVILWNRPGNERCRGVELYDIRTGTYKGHIGDSGAHSDLGVDHNGNDIFVYFQQGYIGMTTLPGATNANTFDPVEGKPYYKTILDPGYGHIWHISCKGPQGVCVVTSDPGINGEAFDGEIYLVYTDGEVQLGSNNGAKVRRLAHHRSIDDLIDSRCQGDEIYFYRSQPQASMAKDGSYVSFASNWGNCNEGAYSYLIDLRDADISSPAAARRELTNNQNGVEDRSDVNNGNEIETLPNNNNK